MTCSGINKESDLVEIIELAQHPFYMGVQFHPEYSSTVLNPHPLFVNFVKTAIQQKNK
jgi:CTP synthase